MRRSCLKRSRIFKAQRYDSPRLRIRDQLDVRGDRGKLSNENPLSRRDPYLASGGIILRCVQGRGELSDTDYGEIPCAQACGGQRDRARLFTVRFICTREIGIFRFVH